MIGFVQSTTHRVKQQLATPRVGFVDTGWRDEAIEEFALSVEQGLSQEPRALEYRFLYDARGSELYEKITHQPEYYPTATEAGILRQYSRAISRITGPLTLVELGSGSSRKSSHLIEAYLEKHGTSEYVPVDVSEQALHLASRELAARHAGTRIAAVHGTFDTAVRLLGSLGRTMGVFLGSSIGNFSDKEEKAFWSSLANRLGRDSYFLVGVDLIKDKAILDLAYNDAAGYTAAFTKNLFERMNRELGAAIDTSQIEHRAEYVEQNERVEIYAHFCREQHIDIEPRGRSFTIREGEQILVEISRKFRLDTLVRRLRAYGFEVVETLTDKNAWFALLLLRRGLQS